METVQVQQTSEEAVCIRDVQSTVHAEMDHAYLSGYFRAPSLETLPLLTAGLIVREAGLADLQAETAVSTLMLIHHGLELHEDIDVHAGRADEKYRQLGVLAGAYYSSKYYRLLARSGQIDLIGRYSEAIQTINEAKAELVREPSDMSIGTERYLHLQQRVHGALLNSLREAYLPERADIAELIELLVRAAVLQRELRSQVGTAWTRSLPNLMVWQQANSEERRYLKQLARGNGSEPRLLSLHVKYGTSADIARLLETSLDLVEQSCRLFPDLADDLLRVAYGQEKEEREQA